jgi:hypothetical protein
LYTGRFYDFLEKRRGSWGIVLRQPIYEKDRMEPVTPGAAPALDRALLESFPVGYHHLAYLQTRIGYAVKKDMPGLQGPDVEALLRPRSRLPRRQGALKSRPKRRWCLFLSLCPRGVVPAIRTLDPKRALKIAPVNGR